MSLALAAERAPAATTACVHCGLPTAGGARFCCLGCDAAFQTIAGLGLDSYYARRLLDPALRPPRPDPTERFDLARSIAARPDGAQEVLLTVAGVQCGACVWLIEQVLARTPGVALARVNMTTCRLRVVFRDIPAEEIVARVERLGYRLVPAAAASEAATDCTARQLMRALAVAGFAAGNVMLMSIAVWAGLTQGMGPATRGLLHWVSALIALPTVAYAGLPFFRAAAAALGHGRTNMDVPISIGLVLVTGLSLAETLRGGVHTYFDSAVMLLFFLLLGRLLDHRARGQARATAERLLALRETDVTVLLPDGSGVRRSPHAVQPGETILVGMGERVGADGVVLHASALLDTSLLTGESVPAAIRPGDPVFAGAVNLGAPLRLRATATGAGTLIADCARLIEAAEGRRGRYVALADRVARRYAPAVHATALLTFLWWVGVMGAPVGDALLTACAVLIITCPCALALAVPAAQVIATHALFSRGVLLRSGTALERLATIDTVVFDKTGTLSLPDLALVGTPEPTALRLAAGLAAGSRHPLARALVAAAGQVFPSAGVVEHPGEGVSLGEGGAEIRLGSAGFCGAPASADDAAELWLRRPGRAPLRFAFAEVLRADAAATIARLSALGLRVHLLSGDRAGPVRQAARQLGIADWRAGCRPSDKAAAIEAWRCEGRRVLMVGDGLNDAPCLAAADVSISPASAADLTQTVADLVFQGQALAPVASALAAARRTRQVMRQNLALSVGYNVLVVPLAAAGLVTPWLAAAAMSLSSVLVMSNSLRLRGLGRSAARQGVPA